MKNIQNAKIRQQKAIQRQKNLQHKNWIDSLFEENITANKAISIMKSNYKPLKQDYHPAQLEKFKNFIIKKYPQAIYFGEGFQEKKIGKGIFVYKNGRIYEGHWSEDYKDGYGIETFANGNKYEGYYFNGKPEGKGIFLWTNGELYDGQWKQGKKHGSGVWQGTKGDSYFGQWKNGCADGYGVHIWVNGDRYEGQFKSNLKHGHGKEIFANGDSFIGNYVQGKPEQYGEYHWINGNTYFGNFQDGLREGFGMWKKYENSEEYKGLYCKDKKNGIGMFNWSNGNYYKGEYKNDNREGIGQMIWADGTTYKGQWKNGLEEGYGVLLMPQQKPLYGLFQNNELIQTLNDLKDQQQIIEQCDQIVQRVDELLSQNASTKRFITSPDQNVAYMLQNCSLDSKSDDQKPQVFRIENYVIKHERNHSEPDRYNKRQENKPINPSMIQRNYPQLISPKKYQQKSLSKNRYQQYIKNRSVGKAQSFDEEIDFSYRPTQYKYQSYVTEPNYIKTRTQMNQLNQKSFITMNNYKHKYQTQNKIYHYNLSPRRVNQMYKSERSQDAYLKHINNQKSRDNSPQSAKGIWVPTGKIKKSPDTVLLDN